MFLAALMIALLCMILVAPVSAYADNDAAAADTAAADTAAADAQIVVGKSNGAGLAIGIAAGAGAIGMGLAVAKSAEGISRQPEAEGKIRTTLMLGLVFIETAIIYALLAVILIIFVL
ncbi:MAG: ATP synthase F0 subunit C [Clostridiales bacterium]|nr:MAG: ATP synthase F0 subunit C [Clostridiales bacterium]